MEMNDLQKLMRQHPRLGQRKPNDSLLRATTAALVARSLGHIQVREKRVNALKASTKKRRDAAERKISNSVAEQAEKTREDELEAAAAELKAKNKTKRRTTRKATTKDKEES